MIPVVPGISYRNLVWNPTRLDAVWKRRLPQRRQQRLWGPQTWAVMWSTVSLLRWHLDRTIGEPGGGGKRGRTETSVFMSFSRVPVNPFSMIVSFLGPLSVMAPGTVTTLLSLILTFDRLFHKRRTGNTSKAGCCCRRPHTTETVWQRSSQRFKQNPPEGASKTAPWFSDAVKTQETSLGFEQSAAQRFLQLTDSEHGGDPDLLSRRAWVLDP